MYSVAAPLQSSDWSPEVFAKAGQSIPPNPQGLLKLGINEQITHTIPPTFPEDMRKFLESSNYNVLNAEAIRPVSVSPGFTPTGSLLPVRAESPMVTNDDEALEVFFNVADVSLRNLKQLDVLPYLAFGYATVDFFFLRDGLDWYKDEVENDRRGVLAELAASTIVRTGIFLVLAILTMVFIA